MINITKRDIAFTAIGIVLGPVAAAGMIIGAITWAQPIGAAWVSFSPKENWHHVMIQLTPWPKMLIDGSRIRAVEVVVAPANYFSNPI